MPFTDEDYLPSEEELTVQEINLSSSFLKAGALHFGKYCDDQCKEFMLCRKEEGDPRKCLKEGKDVTSCGIEFFQKVKKSCSEPFNVHARCLEWSSSEMDVSRCHKTQAHLDRCMLEKLNMERPYFGYFTEIRTHKTNRPHPGPLYPRREYKDDRPTLPDDYPREPSKHGRNYAFYT